MGLIVLDRLLKSRDALVAVLRLRLHRLQGDFEQLTGLIGRLDDVFRRGMKALDGRSAGMGRLAGDDLVEDGAEQVDVGGGPDPLHRSEHQFRRHVGRRASHGGFRRTRAAFGIDGEPHRQPPVHHEDLAEAAEHDVFRLQVAVDHAVGVGEGDRVSHFHENRQVLGQRLLGQGIVPGRSLDAFHCVEQCPVFIRSQIIDGHDIGMVQVSGGNGLGDELVLLAFALGPGAQHFDRDPAIEGRLARRVDDTHAPLPDLVEQLVVGGFRRRSIARGCHAPRLDQNGSGAESRGGIDLDGCLRPAPRGKLAAPNLENSIRIGRRRARRNLGVGAAGRQIDRAPRPQVGAGGDLAAEGLRSQVDRSFRFRIGAGAARRKLAGIEGRGLQVQMLVGVANLGNSIRKAPFPSQVHGRCRILRPPILRHPLAFEIDRLRIAVRRRLVGPPVDPLAARRANAGEDRRIGQLGVARRTGTHEISDNKRLLTRA